MPQATLHSTRITLVPLSDEHVDYEAELDADPQVMRYLGNGQARSRAEVERLHRRRMQAASMVPAWASGLVLSMSSSSGGGSSNLLSALIKGPSLAKPNSDIGSCANIGAKASHPRVRTSFSGMDSLTLA